jgi:hypothetical protein
MFSSLMMLIASTGIATASLNLELPASQSSPVSAAISAGSAQTSKRLPATFRSTDESLENLTLAQVYDLAYEEAERLLYNGQKPECPSDSAVANGEPDPAKLTPGELCAVVNYSMSAYENINPRLWAADQTGVALNGRDWAYVRVLDSALKKMKPAPPTTVFRGTSRKIKFYKPGERVRLKGYTSTSVSKDAAEQFLRADARLMIIKTKSARNLQIYSQAGMEAEYLLPRSSWIRFDRSEIKKLKSVDPDTGNPVVLDVENVYMTEITDP